ncbi:MAG: NB-ARC domain-containing protein [Pyrinomonadaceae bacterium]
MEATLRAALSGMPGVGKTQTAIEYAHRQYAAQTYDYILYARAASETELLTDFVSAAQWLHLPAKDAADFNLVAAAVKAWLEGAEKWLLIFDNADDLAVVRSHLPANPQGHVILTRRPDDAARVARTIRIKSMDADEGALLLLRRAELVKDAAATLDAIAPESAEGARAISREMYGLPLSLDIAGAYINETKKPLDGYLKLYRQQGKRLRRKLDKGDPYKKSVAQAFLLTIEQMALPDHDEEASAVIARAAVDLLRLCAFFAPDAIPLDLIAATARDWGDDLNKVRGDEIWWDETKAKATRFSLLSATSQADAGPQAQTYDMHREVQAVVRDEMDETQRLWAERALQSLAAAFPDVREFANWEAGDLFLPHLQACLEHGDKLNIETETVALLKNQTGFHLDSRARYAEAEPLFKQALTMFEKMLGVNHPNTRTVRQNFEMFQKEKASSESKQHNVKNDEEKDGG